jgi:hypothetical protein
MGTDVLDSCGNEPNRAFILQSLRCQMWHSPQAESRCTIGDHTSTNKEKRESAQ